MRSTIAVGAVVAASISGASALRAADLCSQVGGGKNEGGNFFCQAVEKIKYTNIVQPGTYKKVVAMDPKTGSCNFEDQSYDGPLAPLDKEVSYHFRGPLEIYQIAAYALPEQPKKARRAANERRHGHSHLHHKDLNSRKVGDIVHAVINGQAVSWVNEYDGGAPKAPAPAPPAPGAPKQGKGKDAPSYTPKKPEDVKLGNGDWKRIAYYSQKSKNDAYGLAFLNNRGDDSLSGTFDYKFGNSLSYASPDGKTAAAKNTPFDGKLESSDVEVILFTDEECSSEKPCDYSRPGSVALHGFDGSAKAIFVELSMPYDGKKGSQYSLQDAPALWMLNANIPRTVQYGDCSCWKSGCGEFDILEVLASGDGKCKSTLHRSDAGEGGDSNYFDRPTKPTKYAIVTSGGDIAVEKLADDYDFSKKLSAAQIKKILASDDNGKLASIFQIGA